MFKFLHGTLYRLTMIITCLFIIIGNCFVMTSVVHHWDENIPVCEVKFIDMKGE